MNEIPLKLPEGAVLKGSLVANPEVDDLDQDFLQISLASGVTIDVGWWPQYDRSGAFQIVVYKGSWDDRLAGPFSVPDVHRLADLLERLAAEYDHPQAHPAPRARAG